MTTRACFLLSIVLLAPVAAMAHVGSPDVYYDGYAGRYHLLVTIRLPAVIPGLAQVYVRSLSGDVSRLEVVPMAMQATSAELAPQPDVLEPTKGDAASFSGSLWIMLRGSWKLEIAVYGRSGKAELAVPLPAVATNSARMSPSLQGLLGGAGLLLVFGLLGIVHAANGEANLQAGERLTVEHNRRAYVRVGIALILVAGLLLGGKSWWDRDATVNAAMIYRVPHLGAELQAGNLLLLRLAGPNASRSGQLFQPGGNSSVQAADLVPDHGHPLHLFLIRLPDMTVFWHLHPTQRNAAEFTASLPELPAGTYQLYADIVHQSGFPETQVGTITLPAVAGEPLSGDDSGNASLGAASTTYPLPDGYRMVWQRGATPLRPNQPIVFRFELEDRNGVLAADCENYMGMAGHAVFVSDDGSVFAHVHPEGTASMAALAMVQGSSQAMNMDTMALMNHGSPSSEVSFPYGFPRSGDYHVFVQMKRAGHVETGVFMAHVRE
jgi:hypothetical protein